MRVADHLIACIFLSVLSVGLLWTSSSAQQTCPPDAGNPLNGFIDPNCVQPSFQCICYYTVQVTPLTIAGGDCLGCCNFFTGSYVCQHIGGTFAQGTINETVCAECESLAAKKLVCLCDDTTSWAYSVVCEECD